MDCCIFPFLNGRNSRFRVRPYHRLLCFVSFRSAFRVGDPVIPFLLAGSFLISDIRIEYDSAFARSQMKIDHSMYCSGEHLVQEVPTYSYTCTRNRYRIHALLSNVNPTSSLAPKHQSKNKQRACPESLTR